MMNNLVVNQSDVVIVGAGPAGAALAILLAKSGVGVTLVEGEVELDREFRGPAYQPAVMRWFDEMGIGEEIAEVEQSRVEEFSFERGGKKVVSIDFRDLPEPYNAVVVLAQAALLRKLIQLAGQYPNFTYLGGCRATSLTDDGVATDLGELKARLVVAADGRFSTIRETAGIAMEPTRQSFDLLWFEVPEVEGAHYEIGFRIEKEGLMVLLPREGGKLQLGFLLVKGEYATLRKEGVGPLVERMARIRPELAAHIRTHLTAWEQTSLLDVKMAVASEWSRPGLLLIGDAAHIASPVGALGNKLAIEDAILAHPLIVAALEKGEPIDLKAFRKMRYPEIHRALNLQRIVGKVMLEWRARLPFLPNFLVKRGRRLIAQSPHSVDPGPFQPMGRTYRLLRVVEMRQETADAKTLVFDGDFPYQPGQFVTLRVLRHGRLLKRLFSISSSPGEPLAITVKRLADGAVSPYLCDEVQIGDKLLLLPPSGAFLLPDPLPPQITYIAGGSGITPIYSHIKTLLKSKVQISLLYVNRDAESTIFRDPLDQLAAAHPHFTLHHVWTAQEGRPTQGCLQELVPTDGPLYLCGPTGLMELATTAFPNREIHREVYLSAASLQEGLAAQAPLEVGTGPAGVPGAITVVLEGKEHRVPCEEGQTILDAALAAGLPTPFSCQEGICATCRAHLEEGKVVMDKHEALNEAEAASGKILTCRAKPLTSSCRVIY